MTKEPKSLLVRLRDTGETIANPKADVRRRTVLDKRGQEIGTVTALIDRNSGHVAGAPTYDPEFIDDISLFMSTYSYYQVSPFWGPIPVPPPYLEPHGTSSESTEALD